MRSVLFRSMRDELEKIAIEDPARRFILSRQLGVPLNEIGSARVPGEDLLSSAALKPGMQESMRTAWHGMGPQFLGQQLTKQKATAAEAARVGAHAPFDPASEVKRLGGMRSAGVEARNATAKYDPAALARAEQDALYTKQTMMNAYKAEAEKMGIKPVDYDPTPVQKPQLRRTSAQDMPPHQQLAMEQAMGRQVGKSPVQPTTAPAPQAPQPPQPATLRRPSTGAATAPVQTPKPAAPQVAPPPTVPTPPAVPTPAPVPQMPKAAPALGGALKTPTLGGSPKPTIKPTFATPKVTGTGLGKTMAGLAGKLGK